MSEWIKWEGGECPVEKGTLVDVMFRDGVELFGVRAGEVEGRRVRDAAGAYWNDDGMDNDITAYRLCEQPSNALGTQVSGDHYLGFKVQPVEFINANNLDFLQGSVIKYISRHKLKGRQADVEKAIHFCKLILELQYAGGK